MSRPRFPVRRVLVALICAWWLTLTTLPADASVAWAWDDPVLVIAGQTVHVDVGVPADFRTVVTGSTLTVVVPENVSATLAGVTATSFPITVSLVRAGTWDGHGGVPVAAVATVVGPKGVPAGLRAWQSGAAWSAETYGHTGQELHLAFTVQPSGGWTTAAAARTGRR